KPHRTRKRAYAPPAWCGVTEYFGPSNKGDLAVSQQIEVLDGKTRACFVIDHDGTDTVGIQLPRDHNRRNISFLEIGQQINVYQKPVGNDDQSFNGAGQQHFEIALKAPTLVMHIRKDWQIGSFVERVFYAAQDERTEWIGQIKHHHPDRMV